MTLNADGATSSEVLTQGRVLEQSLNLWKLGYIISLALGLLLVVVIFGGAAAMMSDLAEETALAGIAGIAMFIGLAVAGLFAWLFIMLLNSVKAAVVEVREYAGAGRQAGDLIPAVQRAGTWLTIWKWLLGISFLFSLLNLFFGGSASESAFARFLSFLISVVSTVLYWFALGKTQTFFDAVAKSVSRVAFVRPSAQALAPWLQALEIFQWIGLVLVALGGAFAMFGLLAGGLAMLGESAGLFGSTMFLGLLTVILLAFTIWITLQMIRVMSSGRQFALAVGEALDRRTSSQPLSHATDLMEWEQTPNP